MRSRPEENRVKPRGEKDTTLLVKNCPHKRNKEDLRRTP